MLGMSAQQITMNNRTVPHLESVLGLCTSQSFAKREGLQYYYGSVGYVELTKERHKQETYREGVKESTAQTFESRRISFLKT